MGAVDTATVARGFATGDGCEPARVDRIGARESVLSRAAATVGGSAAEIPARSEGCRGPPAAISGRDPCISDDRRSRTRPESAGEIYETKVISEFGAQGAEASSGYGPFAGAFSASAMVFRNFTTRERTVTAAHRRRSIATREGHPASFRCRRGKRRSSPEWILLRSGAVEPGQQSWGLLNPAHDRAGHLCRCRCRMTHGTGGIFLAGIADGRPCHGKVRTHFLLSQLS